MPVKAALLSLLLFLPGASDAAEVFSEIGPRSSLATNNTNLFDWKQIHPGQAPSDCDLARFEAEFGRKPCPSDMVWVCSRKYGTSVCADKALAAGEDGLPAGNFNRYTCESFCKSKSRRLLTNNEWLVACTGTPHETCLNYDGAWPPGHFAKDPFHACATMGTGSSACMSDPRLTRLMPEQAPGCVSEAGVEDCVGRLGQWVSGKVPGTERGRFNGGLFPQKASSVIYTTTAHGPGYSDYSIGCRCGLNAK